MSLAWVRTGTQTVKRTRISIGCSGGAGRKCASGATGASGERQWRASGRVKSSISLSEGSGVAWRRPTKRRPGRLAAGIILLANGALSRGPLGVRLAEAPLTIGNGAQSDGRMRVAAGTWAQHLLGRPSGPREAARRLDLRTDSLALVRKRVLPAAK